MRAPFKRGDAVIVLSVTIVCLCLILLRQTPSGHRTAKVYENGSLTHVIDLDETAGKREIKINGGTLTVENGSIFYSDSSCPDKLCEKFGKLTSPGDTASCVPNRTVVTVSSEESGNEPDVITY